MTQLKALFYMDDSPGAVRSFETNVAKIDILVPTVYCVDAEGRVSGEPDPVVVETARRMNVPLMPIVVNPGFNQDIVHALLCGAGARRRMIESLVSECRKYSYYGIQFDFEKVISLDRDALSSLTAETSAALGDAGFRLSIAVIPSAPVYRGGSDYARWVDANLTGAYDLEALAPSVDFISLMTYDQHTPNTPPGPIAGLPWTTVLLEAAMSIIPEEKISLGIPLYGRRWHAGMRDDNPFVQLSNITAAEALDLAAAMKAEPQWDTAEHAPWFWFYRDGIREYVFYNDARAFRDRYDLAQRNGLHGFSAWVLGSEDAQLWQALPARPGGLKDNAVQIAREVS